MLLDLRTVYFSSATVLIGFTATLLVLWSSDRSRRELLSFSVALSLLAAGFLFGPARDLLSEPVALFAGNPPLPRAQLGIGRACRPVARTQPVAAVQITAGTVVSARLKLF